MNHQDVTVSNMQWSPPLIMLHQAATEFDNGVPTVAFLDPSMIDMIRRGATRPPVPDGTDAPWIVCTVIHMKNGGNTLCVTESPEAVARLRDAAFGYKPSEAALSMV